MMRWVNLNMEYFIPMMIIIIIIKTIQVHNYPNDEWQ